MDKEVLSFKALDNGKVFDRPKCYLFIHWRGGNTRLFLEHVFQYYNGLYKLIPFGDLPPYQSQCNPSPRKRTFSLIYCYYTLRSYCSCVRDVTHIMYVRSWLGSYWSHGILWSIAVSRTTSWRHNDGRNASTPWTFTLSELLHYNSFLSVVGTSNSEPCSTYLVLLLYHFKRCPGQIGLWVIL